MERRPKFGRAKHLGMCLAGALAASTAATALAFYPDSYSSWPVCESKLASHDRNAASERFETFQRKLGEGSFGTVYLGRDNLTGKMVAIKMVQHGNGADVQGEVRTMRDILGKGGHPNLLELVEVIQRPDATVIVTELVSGGEVFDRLVSHGPFSEREVADVARALARGILFMHKEINTAHCDLKPENLLFKGDSKDSSDLKIVDFGSSRKLDDRKRFSNDIGTTVYWAPENFGFAGGKCASGNGKVCKIFGAEGDMWAVGVILYICLYGRHPFDPDGDLEEYEIARRIQSGKWVFDDKHVTISEDAKDLIRRLLEPHQYKRLTAEQMLEHPWIKGMSASASPIAGSNERLDAFQQARRRVKAGLLAAMISQAVKEQVVEGSGEYVKSQPPEDAAVDERGVVEKTFQFFDQGKKGFVTAKDISSGMAKLGSSRTICAEQAVSTISAQRKVSGGNPASSKATDAFAAASGNIESLHLSDVESLLAEIPHRTCKDKEVIFAQGDHADAFYFVMSGHVEVFVQSQSSGREVLTATLWPGNFFGEGGMLTGKPRSATVRCKGPVELLVLGKHEFEALKGEFTKTQDSMNDLVQGRTLGRVQALFQAAPECINKSLAPDQVLFSKGQVADQVYVVRSGSIALVERDGKEILRVGPEGMLGETGVMTGRPRNATAICASETGCKLVGLARLPFMRIVSEIENSAHCLRSKKKASFSRTERDRTTSKTHS